MSAIGRGLVAGAVGTTLLNAATYLDMALTGRPASPVPARAVGRLVDADRGRLEAYGALGGIATGLAIGVGASLLRSAGVRLPAPLGAVGIGALAMAVTDGPLAVSGVSDPRDWSAADWTRDVVPHLAYGLGIRWAMDLLDGREAAWCECHEPGVPDGRVRLAELPPWPAAMIRCDDAAFVLSDETADPDQLGARRCT